MARTRTWVIVFAGLCPIQLNDHPINQSCKVQSYKVQMEALRFAFCSFETLTFKESQIWTDNWGAEDLRVPSYTIPLWNRCSYCFLFFLSHCLNHRLASPIWTKVSSPPLGARLILNPSGSSRMLVTSHTHFPLLINHAQSCPNGLVWFCLMPSLEETFSPVSHFCLACCCFFLRMPILLVLAMIARRNRK